MAGHDSSRVRLITGAGRGFGRLFVLPLDVTDRAEVFAIVERAVEAFGRLDIMVNNAGYGLSGAIEEIADAASKFALEGKSELASESRTLPRAPSLRGGGACHTELAR